MYAEITLRRDDGTVIHTATFNVHCRAGWDTGGQAIEADGVYFYGYTFTPYTSFPGQAGEFAAAIAKNTREALVSPTADAPVPNVVVMGDETSAPPATEARLLQRWQSCLEDAAASVREALAKIGK